MSEKWYPVVDDEKCTGCGICIETCLYGVYDKEKAPVPAVVSPGACLAWCHSCGNRCPEGAITYFGDRTGWVPPHGRDAGESGCDGSCGID